jgi:hypothetical protein
MWGKYNRRLWLGPGPGGAWRPRLRPARRGTDIGAQALRTESHTVRNRDVASRTEGP